MSGGLSPEDWKWIMRQMKDRQITEAIAAAVVLGVAFAAGVVTLILSAAGVIQ